MEKIHKLYSSLCNHNLIKSWNLSRVRHMHNSMAQSNKYDNLVAGPLGVGNITKKTKENALRTDVT